MTFNYLNSKDNRDLIRDLFFLKFSKGDLPFKTVILPLGLPALVYISNDKQETLIKNIRKPVKKGLTLFGQFYGAYKYIINDDTKNFGVHLNPTSLYKILEKDISQFTNKQTPLDQINKPISKKIETIILENKNNLLECEKEIISFINNLSVSNDKDIFYIEKAIDYIYQKEGLLKVNELLDILPYSQKSLQIKFKKIVGITPIKFVKIIRFNQILIKYQIQKKDINELLFKYNYYDISHFNKDFKLMMNESPKLFFEQKNHLFLDQYLNK
ncbi:helix-turn-helix domain-containing protein [Polaribacter sp. Asnod1-A03]|uniref:helix-turn-helix domain-containing protein n=1 Tax=Polaribacter sp. Asnod1-A03 TaxID=3160581 RepID=UPI003866AF39